VNGVVVRRIRPDEGSLLAAVRLRALASDPAAFGSTHAYEAVRSDVDWAERAVRGASGPTDLTLLAEMDGPVGMVGAYTPDGHPNIRQLVAMWVAPEARGSGVGAALVGEVVAWARRSGATDVVLGVTDPDGPARRLYGRAGFAPAPDAMPWDDGCDLHLRLVVA
jgi:GNAT superfamily N-acetyltransferase